MNRHLSQDTLIQYIFDLIEEGNADFSKESIAAHLSECTDCTARLEKLKANFSTLDVLNEEIKAGDSLIAKTIANAKAPTKSIGNRFIPPTWLSAVAAVLLVGTLAIAIFQLKVPGTFITDGGRKEPLSTIAKSSSRQLTALKEDVGGVAEKVSLYDSSTSSKLPILPKKVPGTFNFSDPPFAPASAIELNVLPKKESTQITIYNSADLTLVREKRKLTLKRGWNWLQFMWANTLIDPTSLSLEPVEQKGKVRVEQLVFPARLKDIGRWLIASEVEGQVEFELTYFTSGVNWRAFYMGTLTPDEKQMKLEGYVRVTNNSGEDYENAETRLIVGNVNLLDQIAGLAKRQYPYNSPVPEALNRRTDWFFADGDVKEGVPILGDMPLIGGLFSVSDTVTAGNWRRKEVKKQGLSGYFLYTIEGTEDIKDKWAKRLPSFDADGIDVESLYKYDEQLYGNSVIRFVSFANDEDHELGVTPMPNGSMKIYAETGDKGGLSFTGSTNIKYIPVNEDVELNLGNARGVIVEPKVMDAKSLNYHFDKKGNVDGYDELKTYQLIIRNTRPIDVKVEIKRHFPTKTWKIETDYEYEKEDVDTVKFTVPMKPQTTITIEYKLTIYHGENETMQNNKTKQKRGAQATR